MINKLDMRCLLKESYKNLYIKLSILKKELFNLRFQQSLGEIKNFSRFRIVRADIARLRTILNNKISKNNV